MAKIKNKDPAFLFYASDFLTGTMMMSFEERGKYITLLCMQKEFGFITNEDMFNICSSSDNRILSKFTKDKKGNFFNERLKAEIDKRSKYAESRRNNRLGKKKTKDNICTTYDTHMVNVNKDINKDKDYYFKGDIIKLNKKDYDNWKKLFSNLDLDYELKKYDLEFKKGGITKNWFMTLSSKLSYQNKNSKKLEKGEAPW